MPWKEASFWIGLTVFGTGLYFIIDCVKEKSSRGMLWLASIVSFLGAGTFAYSMYAYYFPAPKLPVWAFLLVLTWGLIAWDVYHRRTVEPSRRGRLKAFAKPEWELVHGVTFRNETVELDGKRFSHCQFINTKLFFRGTGPCEVLECQVGGSIVLATEDVMAQHYMYLAEKLCNGPGIAKVSMALVDNKGQVKELVDRKPPEGKA